MNKRIATAGMTVVAVALLVPQAATAGVSSVAYFTRNPAASAPEGGLQVANAPDGIISFGAVKPSETGAISSATLTLAETAVTKAPATAALDAGAFGLRACVAIGDFQPGKRTLAEAPRVDCALASVTLDRDGTGSWTGEVAPLLTGPTASIAIVPTVGSGTFQADFAPPTLDVVLDAGGGSGGSGAESFDATEFGGTSDGSSSSSDFGGSSSSGSSSGDFGGSSSSGSSSSGGFSGGGSSLGSFSGGSLITGPSEAAPAITTASPEVAASPTPAAGETPLPSRRRLTGTTTASESDRGSWGQFFGFVIAALAIGGGSGFARNRLVTRAKV